MTEYEHTPDLLVEDPDGRRGMQLARFSSRDKAMIAMLITILGGGTGFGGGWLGVEAGMARIEERVGSNKDTIQHVRSETSRSVRRAEERLAGRIGQIEQSLIAEREERQLDSRKIHRSLGRIEGMLEAALGSGQDGR